MIIADGTHKYVMAVNGMVPGPPMVVYVNQTIEVVIYNDMLSEGTGIHWHGLFQYGTPFMDGVTSVTQCPINIEETFVYRLYSIYLFGVVCPCQHCTDHITTVNCKVL